MPIDPTSLAAANALRVENVQFQPTTASVPRKILILGTAPGPLPNGWVENEPRQVFSAAEVAAALGFGGMLHRLAIRAFAASQGIPTYVIVQLEASLTGGVLATGTVAPTVGVGYVGGTVRMYVAGEPVPFVVVAADDATAIKTKLAAAITANPNLPVIAAAPGGVLTITSKSKGVFGNYINIALNLDPSDALPTGLSMVVTPMSAGAGTPDVVDMMAGLGTDDLANSLFITDVVNPFIGDTDALNAIQAYVGDPNTGTGLYAATVHRPFRALTGNTTAEAAGLAALMVISNLRKTDAANGVIALPGSPNHPAEAAAWAIGYIARINNLRAAEHYVDAVMEGFRTSYGLYPLSANGQWTDVYANRDIAVKAGISPTWVKNGVVTLQNMVTFYRPDAVPVDSNGYRSMRNISIIQNVLYTLWLNFEQAKWKGISIVADVRKVTNPTDRKKARTVETVIDDLTILAKAMAGRAWLYESKFTIDELKKTGSVVIRPGGLGFDYTFRIILSGEAGIFNGTVEFDISIAVTLATA